ncbi:hypothetical protein TCAL_10373, partial [Tigriopus californicus]
SIRVPGAAPSRSGSGLAGAGVSGSCRAFECLTPFKVSVGLLLRNYCVHVRGFENEPDNEEHLMSARQRTKFCLLLLRLTQGSDLPLKSLMRELLDPAHGLPPSLLSWWKSSLSAIQDKGVCGLMDALAHLALIVSEDVQYPILGRASVFAMFLRRITIYGDRLGFSEAASLTANIVDYIRYGGPAYHQIPTSTLGETDGLPEDLEMSLCSSEVAKINHAPISILAEESAPLSPLSRADPASVVHTRRQAEFYIAQQVELVQNAEIHADPVRVIEDKVERILKSNSDLAEAYFLLYLNALRCNDFCGARANLNRAFEIGFPCHRSSSSVYAGEDLIRDPRYAALNLAGLHAHFGHTQPALTALQECTTSAQEANDLPCLQHALAWRLTVDKNMSGPDRMSLLQSLLDKSLVLQIPSLIGFGYQNLSKIIAYGGDKATPYEVCRKISHAEQMGEQSEVPDLLTGSMWEKSVFWAALGQGYLSAQASQLLLLLDTSSPSRDGHFIVSENVACSLATMARNLFDTGHGKAADQVIALAKHLFPNHSSPNGTRWRTCQIEIEFRRSLYETNWVSAHKWILAMEPLDSVNAIFMSAELLVWRGNVQSLGSKLDTISPMMDEEGKLSAFQKIRYHIYRSEWYCLMASYSYAFESLLSAINLSVSLKYEYMEKLAKLHLAHVQLQIGLPLDALDALESTMPILLRHDIVFESSRAFLLLAKGLVASAPKGQTEERRIVLSKAMSSLQKALKGFKQIQAYHRVKDVLYTMARLFHAQDLIKERNQVSAEFRKIEEQHPTFISTKVALML